MITVIHRYFVLFNQYFLYSQSMRKLLSVYLCFFLLFNLHAAEIKWLDETYKKVYRIDTQTQLLEQEKEGVNPILWQKAGTIKMIGVNEYDLSTPLRFVCLQADQKYIRYLLADCTQQVYQFDFERMLLERIDDTFYRGYNCFSVRFIRKGEIYSFGGYGMSRSNNLMTYYQKVTKEWLALTAANDAPKSISSGLGGYNKEEDIFYSGLNVSISPSENEGKHHYDAYFYAYSFKKTLGNAWA